MELYWEGTGRNTQYDPRLIKAQGMQPKDGFVAFNKILIGKTRGPRLQYFLSNMPMDRFRERLKFRSTHPYGM